MENLPSGMLYSVITTVKINPYEIIFHAKRNVIPLNNSASTEYCKIITCIHCIYTHNSHWYAYCLNIRIIIIILSFKRFLQDDAHL